MVGTLTKSIAAVRERDTVAILTLPLESARMLAIFSYLLCWIMFLAARDERESTGYDNTQIDRLVQ
jgi:hypothetical protein